jgi:hypothetical protein
MSGLIYHLHVEDPVILSLPNAKSKESENVSHRETEHSLESSNKPSHIAVVTAQISRTTGACCPRRIHSSASNFSD